MRKIVVALTVLAALATVVGCAKPPQAEIDAAKSALAATAEAREYAPDALRTAEDAMSQLDAELKVQEEKFALFRSYEKAKQLAAETKTKAEDASRMAAENKERTKNEASELIAQAKATLTEVQAMLEKAPTGKGTQADLAAMKSDLQGVEMTLAETDSAFQQGNYLDAKAKAESARQNAESVRQAIEQAIEARKSAKSRSRA